MGEATKAGGRSRTKTKARKEKDIKGPAILLDTRKGEGGLSRSSQGKGRKKTLKDVKWEN